MPIQRRMPKRGFKNPFRVDYKVFNLGQLDFLIENGLIHRIERMNAFVGCSHPGESHRGFFLICGECGNAEELESAGVAESIAASASQRGFAAREMTLEVTGTCAECRK